MTSKPPLPYVGRFAPTPSGHLHFGSLVTALASYLDAKASQGRWLVRIEDLDQPRIIPNADRLILETLTDYGLLWDGPVLYQSQRLTAYQDAVDQLMQSSLLYYCRCSRKALLAHSGHYPGLCRTAHHSSKQAALRIRSSEQYPCVCDRIQNVAEAQAGEDFIIQRRDGIFAYHLAVVVDDAWQGITDVVRGADLLESTPRQHYLQSMLGLPTPRYAHIPLIVQKNGDKLSKSRQAPPLDRTPQAVAQTLTQALQALGQQPPHELAHEPPAQVIDWGVQHWCLEKIASVIQQACP